MDTQTSQLPINVLVLKKDLAAKPVQVCSSDYGFDVDEDELWSEMLTPLPIKTLLLEISEVDADEFEQIFQCFLS